MYALHLEFVVDGIEASLLDPAAVRDDSRCDLGRWLRGMGLQRYAAFPAYRDLIVAHREFHDCAADMLAAHQSGNSVAANRLAATKFRTTSATVILSLEALQAAIEGSSPHPGGASSSGGEAGEIWRESFRIGMAAIDQQHIELSRLIERLNDDPDAAITTESFMDRFAAFRNLLSLHFDTEELFMRRSAMPAESIEQHVREHDRLLDAVTKVDFAAMSHARLTAADVYRRFKQEVQDHIAKYDVRMGDYVATNAKVFGNALRA